MASALRWVVPSMCAILVAGPSRAVELEAAPSPLLAIDSNRSTVVERIVAQWGEALLRANAGIAGDQLREMLQGMRADQLLAASLAGSLDGLRNVVSGSLPSGSEASASPVRGKALGNPDKDLVYVPVTPCRLVETRGTFAAVYQGGGAFATNEIRTYTLQGGNGVCLTQLPPSVSPSAVQMQVYGIPTTTGSGDIEILPQGGTFGSTATLVYLGNNAFTSASATSPANVANKQISVQVRGPGAHVAIDVVGYFQATPGTFVANIDLPNSTSASVGNIVKPGGAFMHNFGTNGTFLGSSSGNFTATGQANTGVGASALGALAAGQSNSAVGAFAMQKNTAGSFNTAAGRSALQNNLIGNNNTAMGYSVLLNATGDLNTGLGAAALNLNTTGVHNVAVGATALQFNTTGSHNIAIGSNAGNGYNTGDYNIAIGSPGQGGEAATIRLGSSNQTRTFIAGIRGVTTGSNDAVNVVIDSNGQLGTVSSSRNAKYDIADMGEASEVLMKLHPVTFRYRAHEGAGPRQYGLIAEEVAEAAPDLVAPSRDGGVETVYYQHLAPMLLNEYQKQQHTIDAQQAEIAELRRLVEVLLARTSPEGRVAAQ
ncbi:MAG: tail fiber domain-containing protein [Burkholderiales bacterium]